MDDVILPNENEEELLDLATKLNIVKPLFCYPYPAYKQKQQLLSSYDQVSIGVISSRPTEIKKMRQKGIFVITPSNNRAVLESHPSMAFELEKNPFKDGMHSRNSGLNHVLASLMKEKTSLGISISSLLNSPLTQMKILGRMRQNIKIARKANLDIHCFSFARNPYEIRSSVDRKRFLFSQL